MCVRRALKCKCNIPIYFTLRVLVFVPNIRYALEEMTIDIEGRYEWRGYRVTLLLKVFNIKWLYSYV